MYGLAVMMSISTPTTSKNIDKIIRTQWSLVWATLCKHSQAKWNEPFCLLLLGLVLPEYLQGLFPGNFSSSRQKVQTSILETEKNSLGCKSTAVSPWFFLFFLLYIETIYFLVYKRNNQGLVLRSGCNLATFPRPFKWLSLGVIMPRIHLFTMYLGIVSKKVTQYSSSEWHWPFTVIKI